MNRLVLLLDSTYEPIRVIDWTRAVRLVFAGKAEVIENSNSIIRSISSTWSVPSVIRQLGKFKRKDKAQFSRFNVYIRDNWTCQYCSKKKPTKELTFDHVLPRSQGGLTNWTNIVTACRPCNSKKDNNTPEQANMKLLKKPNEPKWLPNQAFFRTQKIPEEWLVYADIKKWTKECVDIIEFIKEV